MANVNRRIGVEVDVNTKINKQGLDELQRQLQSLKNLTGQNLINIGSAQNLDQANAKLKEIRESVTQVQAALNKSFNFSIGTTDLTKLNVELQKLDWSKITTDFKNAGAQGQNAFRSLTTEIFTTNLQLKESHTLLKAMGQTMANTIKWGISSSVMNSFTGSVQKAYSFVKSLDTSLNNIRIVTGKSAEEMDKFAVSANKAARELAASTRDYAEASLIYYQQGLSDKEVEARTNVTLKTANVTKQATAEVSEQLTAVWNGYNVSVEQSEAYIDKLAAVAASTAADLEELSTGMSKVASAANAMGVPIDELNAQLATIVSVTRQAPESVGTALRTIYARMGDIEAGLDTETTLGSYTSAMKELGVNVLDAEGNLRDMGEVITEVGNNWTNMTREQQVALAQTMAGTRQYNNLLALFSNWDMYNEALETSKNSLGTLQEQQDIYLQSTEAHLETLQASMERIYSDLIDTDALNKIVDVFTAGAKGVANYIEAIGGASSAFSQLGALAMRVLGKQIAVSLTSVISNFGVAKNNAKQLNAELQIMQQFKGININDDNFKSLVAAKEAFIQLDDAMTESQRNQANALLQQRNELANQQAIWNENAEAAQRFYNLVTGESIDIQNILGNPEEIGENFNQLISYYTTTPKDLQEDMKEIYNEFDADFLQEYINRANDAIKLGLVKDEKNVAEMKKIISDIESMPLDKEGQLSDEQVDKLKDFETYYLKFSNEIKNMSKETLESIRQSALGMVNQLENALKMTDAQIIDLIKKAQTQNVIEGLTQITSSIFMINSAMASIHQLPRIWDNEDISTGEKILQTLMAVGNVLNGLFQGYRLINIAADTLRNAYTLQSLAVAANSKTIDKNTENLSKNAVIQDTVAQPEIEDTSKAFIDQTTAATINTNAIAKNSQIKAGQEVATKVKKSSKKTPPLGQLSLLDDKQFYDELHYDLEANHQLFKNITDAKSGGNSLDSKKINNSANALEKVNNALKNGNKESHTFGQNVATLLTGKGTSGKGLLGLVTSHPFIVAAIAGIAASIWYLAEKSQEATKEISRLEEAQNKLQEKANELTTTADDLRSAFENYNSIASELSACDKGTVEWYKSLKNVNNEMVELLAKYPALAKIPNLFNIINGTKVFNTNVVEDYISNLEDAAATAQLGALATQGLVSQKKNVLSQQDLERERQNLIKQSARVYGPNRTYQENINENLSPQVLKNYEEYLNDFTEQMKDATESDIERVLKETDVTDSYIKSVQEYQEDVKKLGEETQETAIQMQNAAKAIGAIIGDAEADSGLTDLLQGQAYQDIFDERQDYWESRMTGGGISKASGKSNNIYQEVLEQLQKIPGYENLQATANPVRGSDFNRQLAYFDPTSEETLVYDAEYWGTVLASWEAKQAVETEKKAKEIADSAARIKEALGNIFDDDKIIDAIFDKDYSTLGQEQIDKLAQAVSSGAFDNQITKEMLEAAGVDSGQEFLDGIKDGIASWDPEESAETLKNKIKQMYQLAAKELDEEEVTLTVFADMLKDQADTVGMSDEELANFTITCVKQQKAMEELADAFEDNEDELKKWAKSTSKSEEVSIKTARAVGQLKTQVQALFGNDVDLSAQFLKDNFELIQKVINGDTDALDELESKINEQYLLSLGIDDLQFWDDYAEIKSAFDQLNYTDLEIGATFNDEEALAKIQDFFARAQLSSQEAQAVLNKFGYEGELEEVKAAATGAYTSYEPVTKVTMGSFNVPGYTAYGPQGNSISVPGYQYRYPILDTKYEPVEHPAETGTSFWVLKSKAGQSTAGNIKTTGLKGSVKSLGTGLSRKQAVTSYGGGTSSSGGSSQPKKVDFIKDEYDRYHQVDTQISKVEKSLSKLQSQEDKLVGKSLIDNLNKQWTELNTQVNNYNQKLKIARDEESELRAELEKQGVTFNADGTVANYMHALQAQEDYVNSLIQQYNKLSAKQQEAWDEAGTIDTAKETYEKFKENLDRYDELVSDFIPGLEQDVQDAIDEQIDLQIRKFNLEIEVRLDMAEAERDWNEFKKRVIDDIKEDDILGNARARLQDFFSYYNDEGTAQIQALTKQVNGLLGQLREQDASGNASVYGNNRAELLEQLKDYYTQLMEGLEDVLDLQEEIHDAYIDMIDEAADKFADQIDMYETVRDLIEHDMNVIEMVYGEESYSQLSKYYDRQEENYNKQLEFQRMQKDFWYAQMQTMEEGSEEWEAAKENWLDAVDEWNSAVEDAIENLQDKYLNAINEIFQNLNNQYTNGKGLDYIEEEWELINKNAEQYLDTIDATWGIQKLENKYMDAYDATDSIQARRQIKEIMDEELANLREQDKLTQYDIDRANMRYDIMLKQIALQEAQQNKSQMRLRRDSQGNYRYEFIADDDEIGNLQDELGDLYNSLYDFDKEHYLQNLNDMYDLWVEFQEKMAEAAQINDPQARAERELLLRQQYEPLLNGILEENLDIRTNLQESAFDDLAYLYEEDAENFRNMTEEEKQAYFEELIPQMLSGVQELADNVIGEGGFIPAVKDSLDELDHKTQEYEDSIVELQNQAGQSFGNIGNNIDNTITQTENLIQSNRDLIGSYQSAMSAMRDVISTLDNMITKFNNAATAARNAATEARNYWAAAANKAASEYASASSPSAGTTTNWESRPSSSSYSSTGSGSRSSGSGSSKGGGSSSSGSQSSSSTSSNTTGNGRIDIGDIVTVKGSGYTDFSLKNGVISLAPQQATIEGAATAYGVGDVIKIKTGSGKTYWVKKSQISGYDTGGYTGEWGNTNGRLALLHQKELVLNSTDTQNILNAVNVMRSLSGAMLSRLSAVAANTNTGSLDNAFEQNIHIEANFPNVQSSHEIEDAINNLMNVASQRINRRG